MSDAAVFLQRLFPTLCEDKLHVSIFTLPDRTCRWFGDAGPAAEYATQVGQTVDTYFGCGLLATPPVNGRGRAADVAAIAALWADIDFADPVSPRSRPPDEEGAGRVLAACGLPPTVVVHSGHGLQAYWCLREPLMDHAVAGRLAAGWVGRIQAVAHEAGGWTADPVGDLARVMRVPGTQNRKRDPVVPVKLLSVQEDRSRDYTPDDFDSLLAAPELAVAKPAAEQYAELQAQGGPFEVRSPDTEIVTRLEVIAANDEEFSRSWSFRQRRFEGDCSRYLLSLANRLIAAGMTNQQIVDALVFFQRRWSVRMDSTRKPDKHDHRWYIRTLHRARFVTTGIDEHERAIAEQRIVSDDRAAQLAALREVLGVPIAGWEKHGTEQAMYYLLLSDGRDVQIGTVTTAMSYLGFSRALYDRAELVVKPLKAKAWREVLMRLAHICHLVPEAETGRAANLRRWIGHYLSAHEPTLRDKLEDSFEEHVGAGEPFILEDMVYISATELLGFVRARLHEQINPPSIYSALRTGGWMRHTVGARRGKIVTTKSYYRIDLSSFGVEIGSKIPD